MEAPARMDALEGVLESARVAAHVRDAVARAELLDDPVPHAVIPDLLPPDLYEAALAAIPPRVLFEEERAGTQELRVPPTLAPSDSIALWTFVTSVMKDAAGPALVDRFARPLADHVRALASPGAGDPGLKLTALGNRLVARRPGGGEPRGARPWHFLTAILCLAKPGDDADYGSVLGGVKQVPFQPNLAVVVLDPRVTHQYAAIPSSGAGTPTSGARPQAEGPPSPSGFRLEAEGPPSPSGFRLQAEGPAARYTYECAFGPDKDGRRALLSTMDAATRRTWEIPD
jgi:hypothetical protein